MKLYETILSILAEKGPLSIPLICQEVNQILAKDHNKPILPSHVKLIITKNREFFRVREAIISIAPDKHPLFLVFILHRDEGITYQVNVNFSKQSFSFFEWRDKGYSENRKGELYPRKLGDAGVFKREIMTMKIWEWKPFYGKVAGITLGKTNWTIKLKTKKKTYISEGTDFYPKKWPEFIESIEKLTGGLLPMVNFFH